MVRQLEAQVHQGGQDPVAEDQLVVGAGAGGAPARVAAALLECALVGGGPRAGELGGHDPAGAPGPRGEPRRLTRRRWWSSRSTQEAVVVNLDSLRG
ncbi:MAG TPA: hypothetical protein VG276_27490 [Actinomycetes bacterium]|nr:hypothetical protein [Actinomycetes bacterium]